LASPKEQIASPTKIDFYSWRRLGSTWPPKQQSPPQSTIRRSEPTRRTFYRRLSSISAVDGARAQAEAREQRYDYVIDVAAARGFSVTIADHVFE